MDWREMEPQHTQEMVVKLLHPTYMTDKGQARCASRV